MKRNAEKKKKTKRASTQRSNELRVPSHLGLWEAHGNAVQGHAWEKWLPCAMGGAMMWAPSHRKLQPGPLLNEVLS
jgi:hypothetical protein